MSVNSNTLARFIWNTEISVSVAQFIVTNAYFSVTCNTKVSVRATLE